MFAISAAESLEFCAIRSSYIVLRIASLSSNEPRALAEATETSSTSLISVKLIVVALPRASEPLESISAKF